MSGLANPTAEQIPEQLTTKKRLLLDAFRRIEEHAPVWMLPRLIATLNLHKHLSAARKRLCDSHNYQQTLLGQPVSNCEDGGGISVVGDRITHGLGTLGTIAVVLATLGGAVGATALYAYCTKPPAAVEQKEQSTENWRLGLKVSSTP